MRLSPLNFSGLMARQCGNGEASPEKSKRHIEEVTMYRCPDCRELHEWEDEAEECCKDEPAVIAWSADCPVCGERYEEHRMAADCCLWKDLDAPTRWAVADAVEAGSTWVEALQINRTN